MTAAAHNKDTGFRYSDFSFKRTKPVAQVERLCRPRPVYPNKGESLRKLISREPEICQYKIDQISKVSMQTAGLLAAGAANSSWEGRRVLLRCVTGQ